MSSDELKLQRCETALHAIVEMSNKPADAIYGLAVIRTLAVQVLLAGAEK